MENFPQIKKEKVSLSFLEELRIQLHQQIDQLEDEFDEKRKTEKLAFAWLKERKQTLIKNFISELLKQKDSFEAIFETEKGSIYFMAKNGQTWRFKNEEDAYFHEEPITNKMIFLSPEEAEKFVQLKKQVLFQEFLVGMPHSIDPKYKVPYVFKKSTLAIGNVPLEIGISHFPLTVIKEDEQKLRIIGTQRPNGTVEKYFASGIHNGHPISKIY